LTEIQFYCTIVVMTKTLDMRERVAWTIWVRLYQAQTPVNCWQELPESTKQRLLYAADGIISAQNLKISEA